MDNLHFVLMGSVLILSIWVAINNLEISSLVAEAKETDEWKDKYKKQLTSVMIELDNMSQAAGKLEDMCKAQQKAYDERLQLHTYESMDLPRTSTFDF
jgi:hypothetical protein